MRLVRRLVLGEPDVAIGTEHLGRSELLLELGDQGGHRRPDGGVVDVLVIGPERLRVVGLEVVVEVEGGLGEPGEPGHAFEGAATSAIPSRIGGPHQPEAGAVASSVSNRVRESSAKAHRIRSRKMGRIGGSASTGNHATSRDSSSATCASPATYRQVKQWSR